jgi:hypothetical protein
MNQTKEIITSDITTDDLAFSAYLRMKGYKLTKSRRNSSKMIFTFKANGKPENDLKVEFINSDFLTFYNELRNLKKLI